MSKNALSPPRLAYLVTEDWAFMQHRLPMARAAKSAGFDVHVLTRLRSHRAEIENEGFTTHALNWTRGAASPMPNASAVKDIRRLLRQLEPDIVHNVALKPAALGSLAAVGLNGIAVVNSINGLGSAYLSKSVQGAVLRQALKASLAMLLNRRRTKTIVQNPDDRAVLEAIGVNPAQIVLIPGSGVDTQSLQPMPEPPPPVTFAYVGRMLEDKGVRTLVEAFRSLRARDGSVELLLAGVSDPENPSTISEAELETWNRESGIRWLGHVGEIAGVWARSHVAVLPSRREGLPKSLLEAAACGRPLVATDAPGCREICLDGVTGLQVPVDDAEALATAMARLAADADGRRRMGEAARRLAEQRFSAPDIGRQTLSVYGDLLAGKAG